MATQIYVLNNTQGTVITSVQPGATNGPGSAQQTTDLKLFGLGTQRWGEGFDENFVRLTENFACPEKASPPNTPKDSADLGIGNGINKPLNGQLWFNTTQKKLFVFDSTLSGWKGVGGVTASATTPVNPQLGDLWFDTVQQQLKIFNGVSFVSVAERYLLLNGTSIMTGNLNMGGFKVINHGTPTAGGDATNKTYVDAADNALDARLDILEAAPAGLTQAVADGLYVNVTGDTMTGNLIMSGAATKITLPNAPLIGTDAANKTYVDSRTGGRQYILASSSNTNIQLSGGSVVVSAGSSSGNWNFTTANSSADFTGTVSNIPIPSVPVGAVAVILRVHLNTNSGGNFLTSFRVRKNASESFVDKITVDPTGATSNTASAGSPSHSHAFTVSFEGEEVSTFIVYFDIATNTFDFRVFQDRAAGFTGAGTIGAAIFLEAYLV